MILQQKRLFVFLAPAALLQTIPFIAMQFTNEVNWTLFDFVVAGILLGGMALTLELVLRKQKNVRHRIIAAVVFLLALFLLWAELAVGIFGSAIAGS